MCRSRVITQMSSYAKPHENKRFHKLMTYADHYEIMPCLLVLLQYILHFDSSTLSSPYSSKQYFENDVPQRVSITSDHSTLLREMLLESNESSQVLYTLWAKRRTTDSRSSYRLPFELHDYIRPSL